MMKVHLEYAQYLTVDIIIWVILVGALIVEVLIIAGFIAKAGKWAWGVLTK